MERLSRARSKRICARYRFDRGRRRQVDEARSCSSREPSPARARGRAILGTPTRIRPYVERAARVTRCRATVPLELFGAAAEHGTPHAARPSRRTLRLAPKSCCTAALHPPGGVGLVKSLSISLARLASRGSPPSMLTRLGDETLAHGGRTRTRLHRAGVTLARDPGVARAVARRRPDLTSTQSGTSHAAGRARSHVSTRRLHRPRMGVDAGT